MDRRPDVGDAVNFSGRFGLVTALCDEDGVVDDPEDAIAVTIKWEDGTYSAVLVSDLEFTRHQ
jgi:hypothetical protein